MSDGWKESDPYSDTPAAPAAAMIEDGTLDQFVTDRYAGWQRDDAQDMLSGKLSLDDIAKRVEAEDINPKPRSGRQEYLENVINRFV